MKKSIKLTMFVSIVALIFLAQVPLTPAGELKSEKELRTVLSIDGEPSMIRPEELKPGMRIDSTNWQLVDGLMLPYATEWLKNGKWFFTMSDYDCMPMATRVAEKAKQNIGKVTLAPNGDLVNWTCGIPFPDVKPSDPDAGLKMAWNFYHSGIWFADDNACTNVGVEDKDSMFTRFCLDKYGNLTLQETTFYGFQWSGRYYVPPIPAIPGYEHLLRSFVVVPRSPRDAAGKTVLYQVPRDPDVPDDMWIYLPSIRRIRRFPTTQRYATQAPTDYNWDDTYGFNGRITDFTYKYIGEQEFIWPHYKGHSAPSEFKDICMPWNETAIISKCYVVEQYSKNPKYSYSKKVWYLDQKSWYGCAFDIFDRKGERWKGLYAASCDLNPIESRDSGKPCLYGGSGHMVDLQSGHSTTSLQKGAQGYCLFATPNVGLKPELFSLPSLRLIARGGTVR